MTIQETFEQDAGPPVVVNETPLPDQGWAALRQLVPLITAALVARGVIENDIAEIAAIAVGIIFPLVVGQLKTRLRAMQLANLEKRVPDHLLTTKAKAATK